MSSITILILTLCLGIGQSQFVEFFNPYIRWTFGKCVDTPVVQNFNVEKFFRGHWYTQQSFGNFLFKHHGICPTLEYEVEDGEIKELDYHFDTLFKKYVSLKGTSRTEYITDGQGYFPVTYTWSGGLVTYDAPFYVVGTDYENWAVLYSCRQAFLKKSEMSVIMARNRTGWELTDGVKETLTKAGLDPKQYTKAVNVGCGKDEPHL